MGDLIEPPAPTELTQALVRREEDEELVGIRAGSSAKIDQLVHLLKLTPSTEKSLVFSQFTSFLDKVKLIHSVQGDASDEVSADRGSIQGSRVSIIL